jgi:hypothetical protein
LARHNVQEVAPAAEEEPAAQSVHADALLTALKEPAGHSVQAADAAGA